MFTGIFHWIRQNIYNVFVFVVFVIRILGINSHDEAQDESPFELSLILHPKRWLESDLLISLLNIIINQYLEAPIESDFTII